MATVLKILLVEDSTDDQELYRRLLQTTPGGHYSCTIAADGGEALAHLGAQAFDCALVDYFLPGMDGLALLRRIRETAPFMPLVVLTGQARDDLAAAILEAGANNYIDKAEIDRTHLHEAITAAIEACALARRGAAHGPRPILIIDDFTEDREYYRRLLKAGSYSSARVIEATSGEQALAMLHDEAWEAILLDYGLPGMDGLGVLARIRAMRPFVPVVFMTGNGNVTIAVRALQMGASDYLVKALVDADKLAQSISGCVMKCALAAKDAEILAKTAALRASEERNRLLLDSLSEDAIIMLDPDGTIQSWNPASQRIRGYTAEEAIGRNYAMFFAPEDIAAGLPAQILAIARQTGRHAVEGWRVRKGGERMFANIVIDAIRDETGGLIGFANVARDITALARERAALQLANDRIRLATDSGGIGIWDYKIATGEMVWDDWMYRLYHMAPQDGPWRYESWLARIHPADRGAVAQAWQDATLGTRPYNLEFRVAADDGSVHTLRGCAQLTRDDVDQSQRLIGVNWDVTEFRDLAAKLAQQAERLAEARDAAEQANAAKSRFLAGMSHELRTPLNGILGHARLLRLEGGLQPAQLARVDSMLSAGSHLLEMIQCVLDLSEIETERVALKMAPVDLRAVAAACLDIVRTMAEEKGLALSVSMAPEVPAQAMTDPVRLRQILLNLLGNAAKFTRRGGIDLHLRVTSGSDCLRFDIADTGPGIPAEKQPHLFQDFKRVQSGDGRAAQGAGLGLALSARLATLLGGQLGYMDNPGGGSIFWLQLPLLPVAASPAPPLEAPQHHGNGAARRLRALVVDDSPMNLDIAASFLRLMGHDVACVESGAAALAALASQEFDVVFMDVQMPDMDGLEATRRIRALPGMAGRVPVIALTAQVFTEQLEACRRAGMSGHLAKPFTETAMHATLADHVGGPPPPAAMPMDPPPPEAPVIDPAIFAANTRLLKPASMITYLDMIAASATAILATLRAGDGAATDSQALLEAVHKLAGNAGLFGFTRAAGALRQFEHAARAGAADTPALAESLVTALEASVPEAASRLAALRCSAPAG